MVHETFFSFDCVYYTCAGSLIRNVISHQRLKFKKITIKSLKSQSSEAFIPLLNKLKINHSNLSWIPNQSNHPNWKINALNSTLIRMWIRGFPKLCSSRTLLQDVCCQYLGEGVFLWPNNAGKVGNTAHYISFLDNHNAHYSKLWQALQKNRNTTTNKNSNLIKYF